MAIPPCTKPISQIYTSGITCGATPCASPENVCSQSSCFQQLIQNLRGAVEIKNSWNIPGCGQTAVLYLSNFPTLAIGDFLWSASYGYFEIISFDESISKVVVQNTCALQFQNLGTQVPAFSLFSLVPSPSTPFATLEPWLTIPFIAPLVNSCVTISVSSTNTLYEGKKIYIGSAIYTISDIINESSITICNYGGGFPPGTQIFAFNSLGQPLFPIVTAGGGVVVQDVQSIISQVLDGTTPTASVTSTIVLTNPSPNAVVFKFLLLATIQGDTLNGNTAAPVVEYTVDTPFQTDSMGANVGLPLLAPLGIAQPFCAVTLYNQADGALPYGDHISKGGYIYLLPNRSVSFTGRLRMQLNIPVSAQFTINRADLSLVAVGVIR